MNVFEQAQKYIDAIPGAVAGAGGHNQTYSVAMVLVQGFGLSSTDAKPLLDSYNARCSPPWSENELAHKLADAERNRNPAETGKLIRKGVKWKMQSIPSSVSAPRPAPAQPKPEPKKAPALYEVPDSAVVPDAIPDGTRQFIRAVFNEGEGIRIAQARTGEDGREQPKDSGIILSREEWLKKLDKHDGNINSFLKTSDKNGIFVSVNPIKVGGSTDSDVTAYRHALLEFDNISQAEQWHIITASRIPCAAVMSSGGKSIHAWVKINAENRQEFDERVKLVYDHFEAYGPDKKNKNPSRFSRLPGCERGKKRQELLSLSVGCETFAEWRGLNEQESIGKHFDLRDLMRFDPTNDPDCLLGHRWVCRGGSCLFIAPSGIGKSSGAMQMAISWALGKMAFGIGNKQGKKLKSVFIQAENNDGDISEMFQGVCAGMEISQDSEDFQTLMENIIIRPPVFMSGEKFLNHLRRVIDHYHPDIVWVDPLLSFVGDDLSRAAVVQQFFREGIGQIMHDTRTAFFGVHHTGKPPGDSKARDGWSKSDYSYIGFGSSDLTNWARAVNTFIERGDGKIELKLTKRGKRAGVVNDQEQIQESVWLMHSTIPGRIHWELATPPEPKPEKQGKSGRPNKSEEIAASNLHDFCGGCTAEGEGLNEVAKRLETCLAKASQDVSYGTCRKNIIPLLVANGKLEKGADGRYRKGKNA